ncbi:hypothetical protein V6N13_020064 [Hibiscus sabdariffa]
MEAYDSLPYQFPTKLLTRASPASSNPDISPVTSISTSSANSICVPASVTLSAGSKTIPWHRALLSMCSSPRVENSRLRSRIGGQATWSRASGGWPLCSSARRYYVRVFFHH